MFLQVKALYNKMNQPIVINRLIFYVYAGKIKWFPSRKMLKSVENPSIINLIGFKEEKRMRKMMCVVLSLALCLCFAACGENTPDSPETTLEQVGDQVTGDSVQKPEEPQKETMEAFFDNAAFIGDSVTLKLRNYNMANGTLGKATFLCVGSYSVHNAVTNGLYLSYQGQDMTPQDALAACGANKVFIMLGMNDIALFGNESLTIAIQNWKTLLTNIRDKNPDIAIYIQSGTPIYTAGQVGGLNNERMDEYNQLLQQFAQENGCVYVDIASSMKDSAGGLAKAYCSDDFVHFTDAGCRLWISILQKLV